MGTKITDEEEQAIRLIVQSCQILLLDEHIEAEAIWLRRNANKSYKTKAISSFAIVQNWASNHLAMSLGMLSITNHLE
ncbi:MAG: hypothetical protein WC782_16170 [Methylococcaceae bacterium]